MSLMTAYLGPPEQLPGLAGGSKRILETCGAQATSNSTDSRSSSDCDAISSRTSPFYKKV